MFDLAKVAQCLQDATNRIWLDVAFQLLFRLRWALVSRPLQCGPEGGHLLADVIRQ
jgi:hypothetical protein